MNSTNNASARQSYDIAKRLFMKAWAPSFKGDVAQLEKYVDDRKLSQAEIRLEVNLNTTTTNYIFGVTAQQANSSNLTFPTEKRLNQQDSLVVSEMGLFVCVADSAQGNAGLLHTYGNPNIFTTALSFGAIDQTLYSNGQYQLTINNDMVQPGRGVLNHYYRPQTQQIAAIAVGAVGDQYRGAEDGFITVEPNILLVGSKNNVPQVILPTALAAVTPNSRLVLIFRGILAQNSTVVN